MAATANRPRPAEHRNSVKRDTVLVWLPVTVPLALGAAAFVKQPLSGR
ncbi:hypothetical protein [Siccirubricoccus phaeus]|nr:hypothetical protein [Siccirubricoccus phaeus]